ncbi:hypothetical protein [Burkholderia cepacia]|uniref:hypothetical protein n=1 Tax=Burkholderia cepacia TaxID=292 RepID=UPI0026E095AA|nr:hypothetical protein [Burkholderia cepacia]MDO5943342.1 hypothetical protein [Burkholderia cepacia]
MTKNILVPLALVATLMGCNKDSPKQAPEPQKAVKALKEDAPKASPSSAAAIPAASAPVASEVAAPGADKPKVSTKEEKAQKLKEDVAKAKGKRKLIYGASGRMAVSAFEAKNYFGSIVATVEGWRPNFYPDNIGSAVAFGYNVGMQQKASVKNVMDKSGVASSDTNKIMYLVGDKGHPKLPSAAEFSMSEEQGLKNIEVLKETIYEKTARAALGKDFDRLKPWQQAVATYHVYKTGNYANWKSLTYAIKKCAATNGEDKTVCGQAAQQFTYSYMLNGQRVKDTRSNTYMAALFQDPEAYAYLIGVGGVPVDMPKVNKNLETKIDTKSDVKPAEQIEAHDDFNPLKDVMIDRAVDTGKTFDLVPQSLFEKPFLKAHPEFSHVDMSGVPITKSAPASGGARVTSGWF